MVGCNDAGLYQNVDFKESDGEKDNNYITHDGDYEDDDADDDCDKNMRLTGRRSNTIKRS